MRDNLDDVFAEMHIWDWLLVEHMPTESIARSMQYSTDCIH